MNNLTHAMKNMNITDSLKASVFWLGWKFHHDVAFDGLGEDQNISLATESWEIDNSGKRFRRLGVLLKLFEHHWSIFLSTTYRQDKAKIFRSVGRTKD